jgi:hypothetical protein
MSEEYLGTIKDFLTTPKTSILFLLGLMILITAIYTLTIIDECTFKVNPTAMKPKLMNYNYVFIVMGLLFISLSFLQYSEVELVLDHYPIIITVLGLTQLISGVFFFSTSKDENISCSESIVSTGYVQWITGLIITLFGIYSILSVGKTKKKPTQVDPHNTYTTEQEPKVNKSRKDLIREQESKLANYEEQLSKTKDSYEQERLEGLIHTTNIKIKGMHRDIALQEATWKKESEDLDRERQNLQQQGIKPDIPKPQGGIGNLANFNVPMR